MTVNVTYDGAWPDSATVQCDGCALHATAWAALTDEASLVDQARDLAASVGITDRWVGAGTASSDLSGGKP